MKKWVLRILLLVIVIIIAFGIVVYIKIQPTKLDVQYSPNEKYSIYSSYGSEQLKLPYATPIYIQRHSIVPLFSKHELIFMGYCMPEYTWLSNTEIKISCTAEGEPIKKSNSFDIKVIYEIIVQNKNT